MTEQETESTGFIFHVNGVESKPMTKEQIKLYEMGITQMHPSELGSYPYFMGFRRSREEFPRWYIIKADGSINILSYYAYNNESGAGIRLIREEKFELI